MSVEQVVPGLGTVLKIGDGGSPTEVFTAIAQVTEIAGPNGEVVTAETTNLASTAKTFRGVIFDGGEVTFTIQYDPRGASHTILDGFYAAVPPAQHNFQLIFQSLSKAAFAAIITKLNPTGMTVDGNLEAECSLKVTGPVTITP